MLSWLREMRIPGLAYGRAGPACLFFWGGGDKRGTMYPPPGWPQGLVSHFWLLPHPSRLLPVQKEKRASRSHRGQGRIE